MRHHQQTAALFTEEGTTLSFRNHNLSLTVQVVSLIKLSDTDKTDTFLYILGTNMWVTLKSLRIYDQNELLVMFYINTNKSANDGNVTHVHAQPRT